MPLLILARDPTRPGLVVLQEATDAGEPVTGSRDGAGHGTPARREIPADDLPAVVAGRELAWSRQGRSAQDPPRWVWDDTADWYPPLLAAGVRVERCHDLRLCHTILRRSAFCADSALATAPDTAWDTPRRAAAAPEQTSLFDDEAVTGPTSGETSTPAETAAELRRQLDAVAGATEPGRLRLLLAAESSGALIAAELHHDGLPWRAEVHDALLTELLGPRPRGGGRPRRLEELADQVRAALGQPAVNPDSQVDLLRALRAAGIDVASTRSWELREVDHPAIAPLLEYKRLARLLSANGWAWMEAWVRDGRFRPDYVPGGVVTGRWASSGGGALQLPTIVRGAVQADPGWRLVVADAAQLEPRVLAAMSGDDAMATAGRHADLYQAVVDAGIVETRDQAKYAMLGAIYGATTGASAVLLPRLARAYPRAVALVEAAARAGERGETVTTWLGRSSPSPDRAWQELRQAATSEAADAEDVRAARRRGRDWGRFTRNFVVQGTAAEWALCWMAALRRRLRDLAVPDDAAGPGAVVGRPHLVFFLHDEVIVHTPAGVAELVAAEVGAAAEEAGRLLFGTTPVDFALDVAVVDSYAAAG